MTRKRILLINPGKNDNFNVTRIHMGLTLIGQILVAKGHNVKVIDYAFLRNLDGKLEVPSIEEVISAFKPELVGVSVFTYLYDECQGMIDRIAKCSDAPVILGGPHFIMFPDDFRSDKRISYIVRGEVESAIADIVLKAKREESPVFIQPTLPDPGEIPSVNLDIAYGSEYLHVYQIQLSRGCPYGCTFCTVRNISSQKVRSRDIDLCLQQIVDAKIRYPSISCVTITDDCPTADKERFKQFLRKFAKAGLKCQLSIDNLRADFIDEEMVDLYMASGGQNMCLGVESGHPEVFEMIEKGESLDDIISAASLIRGKGLILGLCFVIGLPGDNPERNLYSLRLAKKLKPNYVFWNMSIPWPGTGMRKWYEKNGKVGELRNFSTLIDPHVNYKIPPATTPDFSAECRIKAWLRANMETDWFPLYPQNVMKLVSEAIRYHLFWSFIIWFVLKPFRIINNRLLSIRRYTRQFGFLYILEKMYMKIRKYD